MGLLSGFRARKTFRFGHYHRRYSASVNHDGARARFTSHGLKFGKLTINLTDGTWSYDTPGPGGLQGRWRPRRKGERR
jgi:hypothetical protein